MTKTKKTILIIAFITVFIGLLFGTIYLGKNKKVPIITLTKQPNNAVLEISSQNNKYTFADYINITPTLSVLDGVSIVNYFDGSKLYFKYSNTNSTLDVILTEITNTTTTNYTMASYSYNGNYWIRQGDLNYNNLIIYNFNIDGTESPTRLYITGGTYLDVYTQLLINMDDVQATIFTYYIIDDLDIIVNTQPIYENAYEQGYEDGDTYGYQRGYHEAQEEYADGDFTLTSLIFAIAQAPVEFVKTAFNFEIFGWNISNLILALITIAIVVFVIGIFKRK